jgi:hypothetical protein
MPADHRLAVDRGVDLSGFRRGVAGKRDVPVPSSRVLATVPQTDEQEDPVMEVMIGIDPHKGSHTATMLDRAEGELGRLTMRAGRHQVDQLLEWVDGVKPRTWAVECAGGMGYLLSQQLVAVGERVVDVPAMLASRVRVLGRSQSTKTDPNDARSVAIAALRASSGVGAPRRRGGRLTM